MHGVPCGFSKKELKTEIPALNLRNVDTSEPRIVYIFPLNINQKITRYVSEMSPDQKFAERKLFTLDC